MLKEYEKNHNELQRIMMSSDENRLKVLDIKKAVYRADKNSEEKVISLISIARMAALGGLVVTGGLTNNPTWKIVLTVLAALGIYLGINDFRKKAKDQKNINQDAIKLMDELINDPTEKRSL